MNNAAKTLTDNYSAESILAWPHHNDRIAVTEDQVREKVAASDLKAESGFHWLPFNTLEKHLYNIRHTQLHTGELCERLGQIGIDADWVGKMPVEAG